MIQSNLLAHFDRIADAPDAIPRLRRFILDLAVRGKLVPQDPNDEPASELIKRIAAEKERLVADKKIKKPKALPPIETGEVPFLIPDGWQWRRIGQIGFCQTGTTPSKNKGAFFGGDIPFIKPNDIYPDRVEYNNESLTEDGLRSTGRLASPGTLLMVCIGTIGKCQLIAKKCSFNQQINALTPLGGLVAKYIFYAASSKFFQDNAWQASSRTTISILNKGRWELLAIPVPPLAEQKRIVAKVDELMALCDRLEAALTERDQQRNRLVAATHHQINSPESDAKAIADFLFQPAHFKQHTARPEHIKQLRQTILNLAVRGKLIPQDPNDEPATELLKRIAAEKERLVTEKKIKKPKALPTINEDEKPFPAPVGWSYVRIGELASKTGSGSTPRGGKSAYTDAGIMFLRSQNIYNDGLRLKDVACIPESTHMRMAGTKVEANDLLLNITGGSIGRCANVPQDFTEGNINQHVAIIRIPDLDLPKFVHRIIISQSFQEAIFGTLTGAGREGLPKNRMDMIVVALPPLAEQKRIVAKVDELMALCDQLEARLTTTQTQIQRLLEACLEEAIS